MTITRIAEEIGCDRDVLMEHNASTFHDEITHRTHIKTGMILRVDPEDVTKSEYQASIKLYPREDMGQGNKQYKVEALKATRPKTKHRREVEWLVRWDPKEVKPGQARETWEPESNLACRKDWEDLKATWMKSAARPKGRRLEMRQIDGSGRKYQELRTSQTRNKSCTTGTS